MYTVYISTWNVQGQDSPKEIENILSQSREYKSEPKIPHVVCIQQANLPSSAEETQNYKWLCSGKFGSAILVSKASSLKSGTFDQVCEQICMAEVITDQGTVVKVISCYIPPSTDYVTIELWPKLMEVIKTVSCSMIYIIAGDFNAEIGKDDNPPNGVGRRAIGPKLCHTLSNENGAQLKKMVIDIHASILSTFGVCGEQSYTYKDGEEKSQRSFIIAPTDRVSIHSKGLQQNCEISWYKNYNSAVLSKGLRFTLYERYTKLLTSLQVSCWNVQGASPSDIDKALSEIDLPVVCVQDVFLTSDNDLETKNYTWYTSKKLWGKNVGILIKKCTDISMTNFKAVSEYLCAGNVIVNGVTIQVICCCLPSHTDSAKFEEVTKSLMDFVMAFEELNGKESLFVVAGDFNTHVTFTVLEDTLVFEEGDGNALFLQKFMTNCNVELPYINKNSTSHESEKVRRNSSVILMSAGCMLKYSHKQHIRWVPFFENGVITLHLPEYDLDRDHFPKPTSKPTLKEKLFEKDKVEHVNGFMYVTKRICRIKKFQSVNGNETSAYRFEYVTRINPKGSQESSDLPDTTIEKYKNSPPPIEELLRILGDRFTLYHGFLQESALPKGFLTVLTASFEYLNRGALLEECIEVLEEKTELPVKKIIKFRWNGIVVYQHEGAKIISFKRLINKAQSEFLRILGQHYFTVKARPSFFNNGLPPVCEDKIKLNELMRFVKREDLPRPATFDHVRKLINDMFRGNSRFELVFGPDFSHEEFMDPIKQYVQTTVKFGFRLFKSSKDLQSYDHISVFIDHSPREIRKTLLAIPDHRDLRFQLLPPCGPDKDYFEWCAQWTEKSIPEEFFKAYEKSEHANEVSTDVFSINESQEETAKPEKSEGIWKKRSKNEIGESKRRIIGYVQKTIQYVGRELKYQIMRCANVSSMNTTVMLPRGRRDWLLTARDETTLPQETIDKYCENPPPIEELCRILGENFVLYYGFRQGTRGSCVAITESEVLSESFEATDGGGMMAEYIEVSKNGRPYKHIVKFKWNGICLHEEPNTYAAKFKKIARKGRRALVDKLGRYFYSVKAKITFYNDNGLPPLYEEEKLKEVVKVVKRSEFSTSVKIEDLKAYIKEFFRDGSEMELWFGPEFSLSECLEPIKKFAFDNSILGYRCFKSNKNVTDWDTIALFIKRTPLEMREKLMKLPDHNNLQFYLVPPSEYPDKSHYEWIKYWTSEMFVDEYKLLLENEKLWKMEPEETQQPQPKEVPKLRSATFKTRRKPMEQNRPTQQPRNNQGKLQPRNNRGELQPRNNRGELQPRNNRRELQPRNNRGELQPRNNRREQSRPHLSRPVNRINQLQQQRNNRREQQPRNNRVETQRRNIRGGNLRSPPSKSDISARPRVVMSLDEVWEQESGSHHRKNPRSDYYEASQSEYQRAIPSSQDIRSGRQKCDWNEMDRYNEYSRSQPLQSDNNYDSSYWSREKMQYPDNGGQKRDWAEMDRYNEYSHSQPLRSDNYDSSYQLGNQVQYPDRDMYEPESKRPREQLMAEADRIYWDDIGSLVVVWPVDITSEYEKNPRLVLEANFPTEVSLEPNNSAAVYVTLPLRNGRDKKYCLSVGDSIYRATKNALDLIVNHGSVIKYTENFLPSDGLVPNFIRYNIQCQTNPRTYIILSYLETGPLDQLKIIELLENFNASLNEDLFFDKNVYSQEMKYMLLDLAVQHGFKARHFGDDQNIMERYICVYKAKPKNEILNEVLRMGAFHPKYRFNTNN